MLKSAVIWTCQKCFVTTHLKCARDWADKIAQNKLKNIPADTKYISIAKEFTCPHCSYCFVNAEPEYTCFCGKVTDPQYDGSHPSSCGKVCGRMRDDGCPHPCEEVCHFGRCAPCPKITMIRCYCSKQVVEEKCENRNNKEVRCCGRVCAKSLNCRNHKCAQVCHEGSCETCQISVQTSCFCGKETRAGLCGEEFECGRPCGQKLGCGNHTCDRNCH